MSESPLLGRAVQSGNDAKHDEASDEEGGGTRTSMRDTVIDVGEVKVQFERLKAGLPDRWSLGWKTWLEYGLWPLYATFITIIFGSGGWAFPDGNNPSCIPDDPNHNAAMCGIIKALADGRKDLSVLTSFILGGFLAMSIGLWRTRRSNYTALCGAIKNLLINISSLAPETERQLMSRWAVLGYQLSVLKARNLIDSDKGRDFLKISKLIDGNEWDSMIDGQRHTTVWYWIQSKAAKLNKDGQIDSFRLQTIGNAVLTARGIADDLMSPTAFDQPPPYTFVCATLVNLNLFFYTTDMGLEKAELLNDNGFQIFAQPQVYATLAVIYLYTTIFAMLFDICFLLYNPFGPRSFDVNHYAVAQSIRKVAENLCCAKRYREPDTMNKADEKLHSVSVIDQEIVADIGLQKEVRHKRKTNLIPVLLGRREDDH